jgi:hypothetical protein
MMYATVSIETGSGDSLPDITERVRAIVKESDVITYRQARRDHAPSGVVWSSVPDWCESPSRY